MKKTIFLSGILALLFSASTAAIAQEMKPLVAMDNSLLQAQAWLSRAIDKNSTYSSGSNSVERISKVKFDGCNLSYRVDHETSDAYIDQIPGMGNRAVSYSSMATTLAFDLKEMNVGGITITPLVSNSNMLMLTIPALGGKQSVSYSFETNDPRFNKTGFKTAAAMTVKANVADQIKLNLVKAALMCQRPE
jgi:hypothetical protein